LRRQISVLSDYLGRDLVILDVGGRPDYWLNVGFDRISRIDLLNPRQLELDRGMPVGAPGQVFTRCVGDGRDLHNYADQSVDLVHSNSVIEHVGGWKDMQQLASELARVGRAGWVQTPAWSFPVEQHFHMPIMHWFGAPLRARMLSLSLGRKFRRMSLAKRRETVDGINLLTQREFQVQFPAAQIYTERFLLFAKSYTAHWMPAGAGDRPAPTA
jgi:hypothetical protein